MSYLFTSESVSEGHPDKICDQISDAILDNFLKRDPNSKVACETMVTTGMVVCAGEVNSEAYVPIDDVVRETISKIGYTKSDYQFDSKSCGVLSSIHSQSPDINRGVDRETVESQGAGDQGMMFGYACNETPDCMPVTCELSHRIMKELAEIRKQGLYMCYLRPDSKSQVTVQYSDDGIPEKIHNIVVSTQHDQFDEDDEVMLNKIRDDVKTVLLPKVIKGLPENMQKLFDCDYELHVNPTGKFVIGGPHGDSGLTGRKIIVDTYGGHGAHGGGAFSGKDPSKVDRSGAYAARHIAKNLVLAGVCDRVLVQIAYVIGVAEPASFYVNTYGTSHVHMSDSEIADMVRKIIPLTPYEIVKRLELKNPIYQATASYGHFGRTPYTKVIEVEYSGENVKEVDGKKYKAVNFFTWERTDLVELFKNEFKLK